MRMLPLPKDVQRPLRYGSPRQYLVLRAIRDGLPAISPYCSWWNDVVCREVQDELVKLGWLEETTPRLNQRYYSVTEEGERAIRAYGENPSWSGITEEKWYLDHQPTSER